MEDINDKYISLVAHDAGAASHILAWIKSGMLRIDKCKFCFKGPAAKLLKVQLPNIELLSLEDVLVDTETLLSGTGWASSLEYNARLIAKKRNIYSIAVIDHWVNYKERFERDQLEILPDIIWVLDNYAYEKAKRCFPDIKVIEKRNDYLKFQVEEILSYKFDKKKMVTNILYVLEPIRDSWAGKSISGEFQALDFFFNSFFKLNFGRKFSIILKPHPSDSENKYDDWVRNSKISNIYIEKKKSLANLLAWSDVVVGCETYAMVLALAVNKRVISSLPNHAHTCRLPYKRIERLNHLS